MEDILASIRRILSEDEAEPAPAPARAEPPAEGEVVPLDRSMLVEPPPAVAVPPRVEPPPAMPAPEAPPAAVIQPPMREPVMPNEPPRTSLMAPEAAAAAASSVGSLLRTLASERQQVQVRSGGPTLEDLVREEMRPILKQWLDVNLPPLVERLVRAEIERVVGRAMS
jgi:cell pole-organizing protein PopZ